ncbi:Chorismate dehydratase [bioreactor metagenome]|uniref:Chorismate dehydratase n=1 Tax=bioreactor metagenome TaxID=1076179 RepID=A0A644TFP7_9ZZZZ|nr:menaquinone biosynthesis protein [Negativicutes bacterium]
MTQPRLGHIKFINCLPLTYGLIHGGFGQGLFVEQNVPAQLNEHLVSGLLDASPVSSIIYARNSKDLLLLPDVSISADGALESILLVTKRPIDQLRDARIALTSKSATSHCLLKIVLHNAYKSSPDYFISGVSLDAGVLDHADAVLFIGDEALYNYHNRNDSYYYYDIGDEWKKMTGLRMVYALWVINRQFANDNFEHVQALHNVVTNGFEYGLKYLNDAAATMIGKVPFTTQQIIHYIGLLNYQFTPDHQQAVLTFYRLAHELGLVEHVPSLEFAEVKK